MTWLRIDHNGVCVDTLYLPLNLKIKIASHLSSFLYYILIYNFSFIYYNHEMNYFYESGVHLVVLTRYGNMDRCINVPDPTL